jgi:two-component system CheB/CheR fusion protein
MWCCPSLTSSADWWNWRGRRRASIRACWRRIPTHLLAPDPDTPIPDDEERALFQALEVLHSRTGHDFTGYKRGTVLRRISRRVQLSDHSSIQDYLRFLRNHGPEVQALFDDLLISVTTFFRDPEAWENLRRHVIVPLVAGAKARDPIRIWVPGCATGEEAYSLAILFHEEFDRQGVPAEFSVFATDMDQGALAIARAAMYPRAISADVSDERLDRYFRHDGEHYVVLPELRDHVVFAPHNLLRDPPFARLRLISCRNVLIYLDREMQHHVLRVFRYACRDEGFLFLGESEAADGDLFEVVDSGSSIFRAQRRLSFPLPAVFEPFPPAAAPARARRPLDSVAPPASPARLHLEALEASAPPTVLIDARWNVQHLSPAASRFFQQGAGPLATRVTDLVRPELRDALHRLLVQASAEPDAAASGFIPVHFDDTWRRVAIVAQPAGASSPSAGHVLLTFLDAGRMQGEPDETRRDDPASATLGATLREAERHIEAMRDDAVLRTQELRAANEELQSLNEEYWSTTEELETSREELQSTNEELQTINEELRLRLEEVSRGRSDLENLLAASNVATLFLSADLRITRYSRQLEDIFTIRPRDLDRPIGDLRHTLDYTTLEADARRVLETLEPVERQTASADGRAYVARLSPYRTADDHLVAGVVVTFVDVTALTKVEAALRASERQLEAELRVMRRLHAMTLRIATAQNLHEALDEIVSAAVDLHGAQQGFVQLFDGVSHRLELVAHRGCSAIFLEHCASIDSDPPAGDGAAWRAGAASAVTQIGDATSVKDEAVRRLAEIGGYRALQSMPLFNRDGHFLGILSIQFREPHAFTERDAQLTTLLASQASDLLDARMRQRQVAASQLETSEVRELLGRLVRVQEDERQRFARDVHDQLGQAMTALRMQLELLRQRASGVAELALEATRADRLALELDQNIDFLTWQLRPAALESLGLSAALSDLVRGWSDRFHIPAEFHAYDDADAAVPASVSENLYRIVQEALNNVQKHAQANHVSIVLSIREREATVLVEDDGQGLPRDVASPSRNGGFGLVSMRERAMLVGGELTVESSPGKGTLIYVRVPLGEAR